MKSSGQEIVRVVITRKNLQFFAYFCCFRREDKHISSLIDAAVKAVAVIVVVVRFRVGESVADPVWYGEEDPPHL